MFDSTEQSWADLSIFYNGNLLVGARAVMDETTSDDELLFAAGRNAHAIQAGNKSHKGSLTVLFSDLNKLTDAAVAAGYDDLTDVRGVDVVCTYNPVGVQTLRTRRYKYVKFSKTGMSQKQGEKFIETELPFLCLDIEDLPN